MAVVGESGSGKTTLARGVVGLLRPTGGRIRLDGTALPERPGAWRRALRRRLQIVFQNPDLTLNPRRTVLEAVVRPLELFGLTDRRSRRAHAARLLEAVGLGERHLDLFPNQISGGQRQRVAIARAFACRPDLVVCDEPTSALDVSVQATVLNLLADLQAREQSSYLFISHDLSVVRHIADRVAVLYLGRVCEIGGTEDVFAPPWHPYTEVLLQAVPSLSAGPVTAAPSLEGPAPDPSAPPSGCPVPPSLPAEGRADLRSRAATARPSPAVGTPSPATYPRTSCGGSRPSGSDCAQRDREAHMSVESSEPGERTCST